MPAEVIVLKLHQLDSVSLLNQYVSLEAAAGWLTPSELETCLALRDEVLRRMLAGANFQEKTQ